MVHKFTLHWSSGKLAEKLGLGSSLILRRSQEEQSILLHLMATHRILAVSLTEFLKHNGLVLRALATKSAKIRALLRIPFIADRLAAPCKEALEKKLQKMDSTRQSKAEDDPQNPEEKDDDENQAGIDSNLRLTLIKLTH